MPITINTPQSYFFTDSAFTQLTNPTTPIPGLKSFGPIDPERFQITTTFKGNLNAYAVTAGILLIGKQAGSTDKINIILKPTGTIGVGVKIKYFIYRGINASDFLKNLAGTEFINENSYLDLIKKVWKAYTEFNATTDNLKGTDIGLIDATAGITKDILKKYFDKNNYNLLKVNEGTLLGKFFQDSGGFEIVLDDGDYSQEKSDTGLNFDLSFITATSTILTTKDSTTANLTTEFGAQSNTQLSGKIFKENIHKFLDPAAFYGSHVTDNTSDIANTGIIYGGGTSTPYCSMSSIYNNIVKKFKNKYITYFYVKGNKNRSLNFYNNTNELKINGTVQNYSSGWPIIITSQSQCSIDFTNIKFDDSFHSSTFLTATSALSSPSNGYLFSRLMGAFKCNLPFTNDSGTRVFSSFTYLYFNDSSTNQYDYLFGPANLASIFDREDYTSKLGAAVNNLKKVLIRQSDNVCNYSLKLILDGYLADSHPTTIPTDPAVLASTLRTYILFPQETEDIQNVNATYYSSGANNSHEYCSKIYGSGEIWKGKIYDAENISALLYRRKDNDESKFPIHQLGISQADYIKLTNSVYAADEHATNLLFYFDNEYLAPNGAFFKYDLKIEYDKRDGTREKSIVYISIYTIDTFLFFSKEYANNFPTQYCETFADIAVDFLPHNLASHNTGYKECGFDYIGFDGREKYRDIMGKYFNSSGKPQNLTDGVVINFMPVRSEYYSLLNKYNPKPTNFRTGVSDFPFHTDSFVTLNFGNSTTIRCKITKSTTPTSSKLFYKYNAKYVSIDNPSATATATDSIVTKEITPLVDHTIKVKALQRFDTDQIIEVIDDKGKIAGKMHLVSHKLMGDIKILLVNCKTNIYGTTINEGLPSGNHSKVEEILTNFLNQIYLKPTFKHETLDLATASTAKTNFNNNHVFPTLPIIKSTNIMFQDCVNLLTDSDKAASMVLLFFDDYGAVVKADGTKGVGLGGEAYALGGAQGARIFTSGILGNTIAHEALHSLGLYHTFDIDGEFTFRQTQNSATSTDFADGTDNVMDYFYTDSKRKFIWMWQMKKVYDTNNNAKIKRK